MSEVDWKLEYTKEKLAREKAERWLETRSTSLLEINERLLHEYESTARKSSELEFLLKISNLSVQTLDQRSMIHRFLASVLELCKWSHAELYEANTAGGSAILEVRTTSESYEVTRRFRDENQQKLSQFIQLLGQKKSLILDDQWDESGHPVLGIPIMIDLEIVAVAVFYSGKSGGFGKSTLEIIESGSTQLSSILSRKEVQRKLDQSFLELQQTQQQLLQSEKLASLGTIAAGVAHEINNPLGFLMSNLESLDSYMVICSSLIEQYHGIEQVLNPKSVSKEVLAKITSINDFRKEKSVDYILGDYTSLLKESLGGVERIRDIVASLKTFARASGDELSDVEVNSCIDDALKIVGNEVKYNCEVKTQLAPDLPLVRANPGHLLQVFMNLILNASQAIEKSGIITLRTYKERDRLCVSITDNGTGIKDEDKSKLFTPFFTTKPVGKGTGLGLSVSYGIIKNLGGTIEVESQTGKGSTFTVTLPLSKRDQS